MDEPQLHTETLASRPLADERRDAIAPGACIGRFVVERVLGSGGMGYVVAARDPDLQRSVAIKVLHAAADDRLRQERLVREARTLARIDHENVVAVHEVGEHEGRFFIVMELCEGQTLRAWLRAESRTPAQIVSVFLGAARGLALAHDNGIVHRDFKPDNVIVDQKGRARVVDFGIANEAHGAGKSSGEDAAVSLTLTREAMGTPAYMAPEQLRGEKVDAACDQYSFCLALCEALQGRRPERDLGAIASGHDPGALDVPRELPRRIRDVLSRGLQAAPSRRFASMQDLARALENSSSRSIALVLLAVAALALAFALLWPHQGASPDRCARSSGLAEIWNPQSAKAMAASLAQNPASSAKAVSKQLADMLDARVERFAASHRVVCEASARSTRAISSTRSECLHDALAETRALVEFWQARGSELEPRRAIDSAAQLRDPRECESVQPEADAAERTPEEEAMLERFRKAKIARMAGDLKSSQASASALIEEARADKSNHILAQSLLLSGDILGLEGEVDKAELLLREGAELASRIHDDRLAADTWGALVILVGIHGGRPEEALSLSTAAAAAVARLGDDPKAKLQLLLDRGNVLYEAGQVQKAESDLSAAVALAEGPPAQADRLLGSAHFSLALLLSDEGKLEEAGTHLQAAYAAQRREFGEIHPAVVQTLGYMGLNKSDLGAHEEALVLLERAAELSKELWGPEHGFYAISVGDVGEVLGRLGRYQEGLQSLRLAHELMAGFYGEDHPNTVSALGRVGGMLEQAGRHGEAIELLTQVVEQQEKSQGETVNVASSLLNLGLARIENLDFKNAEQNCQRALRIKSEAAGAELASFAREHACIGSALAGLGQARAARAELDRALDLAKSGLSEEIIADIEARRAALPK